MRLTRQMSARIRANIHTYETLSQTVAKHSSQATYAHTAHSVDMLRHNVRFRELQPNVGSFRFALHEKLPLRKQALSSVSSRKILRSHTRIRFDIFQSPPAETRPTAQDTTKCPTHYRSDSECHAPTSSINGNPCAARPISQLSHAPALLTKDSPLHNRSISKRSHAPTSH